MASVIESIKTYIATYGGLVAGAGLSVDYQGESPTQYSLVTLPTNPVVEENIDGSSVRQFDFALQSTESTADELERIQTNGFYESFAKWLESQTEAGTFPEMESGMTPTKISALSWAFLSEQGQSDTGVYQITCRLEYDQAAP